MFFVLYRGPRPDANQWSGRRWLAALDALLWPAAWIALLSSLPGHGGVAGAVAMAVAALLGISRATRAVFHNERYWFATWRYGKVLAILMAFGLLLRLLLT